MSKLGGLLLVLSTLVVVGAVERTEEEKLQLEVYIIAGVFGGVTLVLCLMVLGLAFMMSKISKQVASARKSQSQPRQAPGRDNYQPDPEINVMPPRSYNNDEPRRKQSTGYKRDEIPLEPVHHQRDEYGDQYRGGHNPGQGYMYRGDDRPDRDRGQIDRSSQYSWEPIPRSGHGRGDDARSPRYNYRR